MAETRSSQFEMRGYNHIALVCSDMQKTVDFYEGILGFPLIKTLEFPNGGGQHFFFQVTESDGIAFFWFPNAPASAPGIAGAGWGRTDEYGNRLPGFGMLSAAGSMHHLAFDVPLEKMDEYRDRLIAAGVEVTDFLRHADDSQGNGEEEFIRSLYFGGPDGIVLEFASWTRPLNERDVSHTPARAEDAPARLAERAARRAARRTAAAQAGGGD
jgi:catechol 2,3-dioxygenase-like lactoylglutathione lyase family enzyme